MITQREHGKTQVKIALYLSPLDLHTMQLIPRQYQSYSRRLFSTKEFSAKFFRPTEATTAIAQNLNPEIVRKVGRRKNQEVFFD